MEYMMIDLQDSAKSRQDMKYTMRHQLMKMIPQDMKCMMLFFHFEN